MTSANVPALDPEMVVADYLGKIGAEHLAQRIRAYWSGLGHDQVRVWLEPAHGGVWAVRSNLARGLPTAGDHVTALVTTFRRRDVSSCEALAMIYPEDGGRGGRGKTDPAKSAQKLGGF